MCRLQRGVGAAFVCFFVLRLERGGVCNWTSKSETRWHSSGELLEDDGWGED